MSRYQLTNPRSQIQSYHWKVLSTLCYYSCRRMKTPVVLCCLLAVAIASDVEWESFKSKFGRRYKSPTEEAFRKKIFLNNKMHVDQQNQRHAEGKATFTMAINQFADLTTPEFSEKFNSYKMSKKDQENVKILPPSNGTHVDWRTSGCVGYVQDQGQCPSTWAYTVTGTTEFYNCRAGKYLFDFNEEFLIYCMYKSTFGCGVGWAEAGFQYIIDHGISVNPYYPYDNSSAKCDPELPDATLSSYTYVQSGSEAQLQSAVDGGVVSVAIDASHISFQLYSDGVYYEPLCTHNLDLDVLAIGYGTDPVGGDYWIVQNSWGPIWGQRGYIWMSRNRNNNCGISDHAIYAAV